MLTPGDHAHPSEHERNRQFFHKQVCISRISARSNFKMQIKTTQE